MRLSGETVHDSASSLKIYRAHAIKGLKLFRGAHRYFPTLVKMRGYKVYETPVKHSHRFVKPRPRPIERFTVVGA